jgi:hypothetical protein
MYSVFFWYANDSPSSKYSVPFAKSLFNSLAMYRVMGSLRINLEERL